MNDRNRFTLAVSTLVLGVAASAPALACPDQAKAQADARAQQTLDTALRVQPQPAMSRPVAAVSGDVARKTREESAKQRRQAAPDKATAAEQQRLVDAAKLRLAKNG